MFSGLGGGSRPPPQKDEQGEQGLDGVLSSPESKIEFMVVILMCMDQMRRVTNDAFDPSLMSARAVPRPAPSSWDAPEDNRELPPSYGQATTHLSHDEFLRRQREVADPAMQELKNAALSAFGKWRVQVLKRVAEILKVRSDVVKATKTRRDALRDHNGADLIDIDGGSEGKPVAWNRRPVETSLTSLGEEDRILLVNSLLLLLLSLEAYSSYSRVLLLHMSLSLKIPVPVLNEKEDAIAHGLLVGAKQQMSADEAKKRDNNRNASNKAWKVGLATVAGAAVIGLTGGLAAPLLAGTVGSILGGIGLGGGAIVGLLGGLASNFVIVGTLFGAYGGSMTGKMMEKYAREVEDFEFIPLRQVDQDQHRLRVAIGISGWLSDPKETYLPWLVLGNQIEGFVLQWEVELLMKLGASIYDIFTEVAIKYAAFEIIKRTIFAGLLVALWPLGLLRLGKALSNNFSVSQARADRAGEVLADALIHKAQGERPATLIGYSLGARVIFSCLKTLAKKRAFGLVESAIFIGTPASAESPHWREIRSVVTDRVINVHSQNDYVLGLVFRTSSITPEVAGLQAVGEVAGVENFDVSDLVSGHLRYRYLVGHILQRIGFESLDHEQVTKEKAALARLDEHERKLKEEAESKRKESSGKQQQTSSKDSEWDDFLEAGDKNISEMNDKEIERRLQEMKLNEEKQPWEKEKEEKKPVKLAQKQAKQEEESRNTTEGEAGGGETKQDGESVPPYSSRPAESTHAARNNDADDDSDDGASQGHRIVMLDTED